MPANRSTGPVFAGKSRGVPACHAALDDFEERARHDGTRERALNELGWCVVRVLEHHAFSDLDAVVACIAECARRLAVGAP